MADEHVQAFLKTHGLVGFETELYDALYDDDWGHTPHFEETISELERQIKQLEQLLNTPELKNFTKGVEHETAHQRWRWGTIRT